MVLWRYESVSLVELALDGSATNGVTLTSFNNHARKKKIFSSTVINVFPNPKYSSALYYTKSTMSEKLAWDLFN